MIHSEIFSIDPCDLIEFWREFNLHNSAMTSSFLSLFPRRVFWMRIRLIGKSKVIKARVNNPESDEIEREK